MMHIVLIANHPADIQCTDLHTHTHTAYASTAKRCNTADRTSSEAKIEKHTGIHTNGEEIKERSSLRKVDKGTDGSLLGSYCS